MPHRRPGILGIFQKTTKVAFLFKALRVRQNPRHHPAHRVGDGHGGDFPAGEDKISQGDFLVHAFVDKPLVNALVVAADQNQVIQLAQPDSVCLAEGMATGRQVNGVHRSPGLVAHRLPAAIKGICRHDGSPTAAVGIIVHLILLVCRVVPNLVGIDGNIAPLLGATQDALGQHISQSLRKQGQDVNSHRCAFLPADAPASRFSPCP